MCISDIIIYGMSKCVINRTQPKRYNVPSLTTVRFDIDEKTTWEYDFS